MSKYLLGLLCSLSFCYAIAQTDGDASNMLPAENAVINYRLAGFSVPVNKGTTQYIFEVANDSVTKESAFNNNIVCKETSTENRAIILLPEFGRKYTWRVTYIDAKGKKKVGAGLYHFATGKVKTVDTSKYRMRIIDSATDHTDMAILLDLALVMYDMKGNPLWYMPPLPILGELSQQFRDLKPTADGTFTVLTNNAAHEFDYNGNLLWTTPNDGKVSGDSSEFYHHEFTKLSNGHYMVAGDQGVWRKLPGERSLYVRDGDPLVVKKADSQYYKRVTCGTLIEYDAKGKVVWSWKSSNYFLDKDLFRVRKKDGFPFQSSTHMNAFDFDEQNKVIYVSFRDVNRIVKIEYPSGKVLGAYGEKVYDELNVSDTSPFYGQHCTKIDRKTGNLLVYNNNFKGIKKGTIDPTGKRMLHVVSHLNIFREAKSYTDSLENIWDFPCDIDTFAISGAGSGGSIALLDDDCVFASMGAASRVFIVNRDKKILWNALPQLSDEAHNWLTMGQYRANYIKKENMGKYIFFKSVKK